MTKVHNFYAGPAILPQEAIDEAIEGLKNFKNMGLSVVEISPRTPEWESTMEEAEQTIRDLFNIGSEYAIAFMQGGASTQFTLVPLNFLPEGGKAAYTKTGTWASNAIKEAKFYGQIDVVGSSEDKNFSYIPKGYTIPSDSAYFHITTNNTIFGTQVHELPDCPVPLIADMSSDIFSRPIDLKKYDMIYAGAQKNMGPAGATLVIIKKDLLGKSGRKIPTMFDYKTHIEKQSMFNTPPVFAIYLSYLTLKWLKNNGGVAAAFERNKAKSAALYAEIDRNPLFEGTTTVEDRSMMNLNFIMKDKSLENKFLEFAKQNHCVGLEGHRSIGGFRASLYNALPLSSVQFLVDVMKEFEQMVKSGKVQVASGATV